MPENQIAQIIQQLRETLSELQETKNREARLNLLQHMRRFLLEAERVLD